MFMVFHVKHPSVHLYNVSYYVCQYYRAMGDKADKQGGHGGRPISNRTLLTFQLTALVMSSSYFSNCRGPMGVRKYNKVFRDSVSTYYYENPSTGSYKVGGDDIWI